MRFGAALLSLGVSGAAVAAPQRPQPIEIPTGQQIAPLAAQGATLSSFDPGLASAPSHRLGWVVNAMLSPDGKRIAFVTAGVNGLAGPDGKAITPTGGDFILVADIVGGRAVRRATLPIPASYGGLAWGADGKRLFASLGVEDKIATFVDGPSGWQAAGIPVMLGHTTGLGVVAGDTKPLAAGIALVQAGRTLAVANRMNDSISLVDLASGVVHELDLRPGGGQPGGTSPYWIVATSPDRLWVTGQRDGEAIEVILGAQQPRIGRRVLLKGTPNRAITTRDGRRLFIAEDNSDLVEVIDPSTGAIVDRVATLGPFANRARGASPNSLALSPDERTLYVTNGGANALSLIRLDGVHARFAGLTPTGWFPSAVVATASRLFVVDEKTNAGPNRGNCTQVKKLTPKDDCRPETTGRLANNYILQRVRSDLLSMPIPAAVQLSRLTAIARRSAHLDVLENHAAKETMAALASKIRHVIYIVKENRTYDQVLGDMPRGANDPRLTQFPRAITPNQHALAEQFVQLDHFMVSGEVSGDGWQWSTAGRASDVNEKLTHVYYADRGGGYDSEGTERNINVSLSGAAARRAATPMLEGTDDRLAGPRNSAEIDGPEDERGLGYLWNGALRAGKSLRNYGFFIDLFRYGRDPAKGGLAPVEDAAALQVKVAFPADAALAPYTDPYFRGFDNQLPDYFRFKEWKREFDGFVAKSDLPSLSLVRLMNDHMGAFDKAIRGVNTPETQQADNDYALGQLVEAVAKSPFAKDTLIFVLEDDAQDGPDHLDAHRSIAFVAGPYVRKQLLVSTRYTTVDMLRTIETVLGIAPANLFDRGARPMADLFDVAAGPEWNFRAEPAQILYSTKLPLPPRSSASIPQPRHDAAWWVAATRGFDWSREDRNDAVAFNRVLASGLETSTGENHRKHR